MITYQRVSSRGVECEPQQDPDWVGPVTSKESTSKSVHSAWIMRLRMWFPGFEPLMYNEIQRSCGIFWQSSLCWDNKDMKNALTALTVSTCTYFFVHFYISTEIDLSKALTFLFFLVMLMLPLHAGQRIRCVTGCKSRVLVFMWTWLECGSPLDRRCYRPHNTTWRGWDEAEKFNKFSKAGRQAECSSNWHYYIVPQRCCVLYWLISVDV